MIHHDMIGEGRDSPYHILFGRDRPILGIPYTPERVCEDAIHFVSRMKKLDETLAQKLNELHRQETMEANQGHLERATFATNSLVWVIKPDTLDSTAKIESRWRGPLKVISRVGERSYLVGDKKGRQLAVHVDQIKPYITLGEVGELQDLPLGIHTIKKNQDPQD